MDFRPSAPQQLLVATARQFLAARCPIELVQRLALDDRGFDPSLWRGMAELGWQGLLVPPELGGSGGSLVDVILLVEEMGRACLPGPFVTSAVAATSALVAVDLPPLPLAGRGSGGGSEPLPARLLPAMADGARIATLAVVEERASFDPDAVALSCEVPGRLTGRKLFVKDAHLADDLIVALRGGGDLSLVRVPSDRAGVTRLPLDTGGGERLFEVTFDAVEIGADDLLGAAGHGRGPLTLALRAGALARTAEMVGAAQHVMELAVAHAKTRVQGGRPIGGHQAIQHACADLVRDVDAARGLLYAAAWEAAEGDSADRGDTPGTSRSISRSATALPGRDGRGGPGGPVAKPPVWPVAMAKAYAGEACLRVARRAHQIFGAIGYCEEHPLHLFHKRIQAARLDFGDADLHLETVARAIGL
jgi:alkylation response protein AidB-like acyl-CoA dehydrogenase